MEDQEIEIPIAHLSFSIETTEEVALSKVFKKPFADNIVAYSVSWSEWIGNGTMVAETEEQIYKVKKFQKFSSYEEARKFFLSKVDLLSSRYRETIK